MTGNDEPTVALLLHLAAGALGDDTWEPDSEAVRRRGRMLRARRTVATVVGGLLAVGVAAGVPALAAGRTGEVQPGTPTSTATLVQQPRSFGDGAVAELEDGAAAVNVPARTSSTQVLADGVAGYAVSVTQDGETVHVQLVSLATQGTLTASVSLVDGGSPTTYGEAGTPYPNLSEYGRGGSSLFSVFVGVLPSWQRDPTAYLFSAAGWPAANGQVAHAAEVPTFHPPADPDRLMYVVVLTGEARQRVVGSGHTMSFVGAAGDAFWPECGRSTGTGTTNDPGRCAALLGVTEEELQGLVPPVKFDRELRTGSPATATAPDPVDVAPGIRAVLSAGTADARGDVAIGTFDGAAVRIGRDGSTTDARVHLTAEKDGRTSEPVTYDTLGPWATVGYTDGVPAASGTTIPAFVYGTVPPDMSDPTVFVYSPAGFVSADGTRTAVLGVPTFTMPPMADGPIEDDRAWFAVGFSGDALSAVRADGGLPFRSHVLFVGRDGTVRDSTCDLAECTDAGSRAAYATVRELVSSYAGLG